MIGKTLAHYEILDLLGKGGMGEVYRARDGKLGREVALKLLPPDLADDTERLARLQREARTLATIHHPRVASLFGIEEADGATFLVMELVEGQTLAERLDRGDLKLDEAISIARMIAEGLEEAHRHGVVHRDLKPANIKITPQDEVKILDFGLARAYANEAEAEDLANSPTITAAMTQAGVILGTAAYMSPEQAKGKAIDLRSDIWSFGVILYELVCKRRLFEGETVSETMADVMKGEIDFDRMPAATPRWLRRLLERCLDRDPRTRLQSIGEARIALERGRDDEVVVTTNAGRAGAPWWLVAVSALIALAAIFWVGRRPASVDLQTLRFEMSNPFAANVRTRDGHQIAISPDGRRLAAFGSDEGRRSLYIRSLDSFEWRLVNNSVECLAPTFSPDGRWIAFVNDRAIWKVSVTGGAPIRLAEMPALILGLDWGDDGFIYGPLGNTIWRVSEEGGERETLVSMEGQEVVSISPPSVLRGGRGLVFHGNVPQSNLRKMFALDLRSRALVDLGQSGTAPIYLHPGAILFAQDQKVLAARFDVDDLEIVGSPIEAFDDVWIEDDNIQLEFASNGTLIYLPTAEEVRPTLLVVNREGVARDLLSAPLPFHTLADPRLSPDGRKLVLCANRTEIWVIDLLTETPTLLSDQGFYPVWTPDGRSVVYGSSRKSNYDLFRMPVDMNQPERLLRDTENNLRTVAMSDQGALIFREEIPGKGMDIFAWTDLDDETTITPLLAGPDDELSVSLSPDGRWMVFLSDQSGTDEIYATAFPRPSGRIQISSGGGLSPAWSTDGSSIFYVRGTTMMEVEVETDPEFRVVSRRELFTRSFVDYRWYRQYDVMPDGEHFLLIRDPERRHINVITNWRPELERLLAEAP